jgi:hypothetical protein
MDSIEVWQSIGGWGIVLLVLLLLGKLGRHAIDNAAKIVALSLAIRGSQPGDRAEIITAVARLFRRWSRPRRSGLGPPPEPELEVGGSPAPRKGQAGPQVPPKGPGGRRRRWAG